MADLKLVKNGQIFIMPNKASRVEDFGSKDIEIKYAEKLCKANRKRFNTKKDLLVECGIYSDELDSSNIPDQGFLVEIDNKVYRVFPGEVSRYIPNRILASMKEGITTSITFPDLQACELVSDEGEKHYSVPLSMDLTINFTPSQTKYTFGEYEFKEFEKLLKVVCQ